MLSMNIYIYIVNICIHIYIYVCGVCYVSLAHAFVSECIAMLYTISHYVILRDLLFDIDVSVQNDIF